MSDQSLWYKDAIIYELHVRAFYDSNGDGIGDFRGLADRIDYLADLGITAIWLLPFYPSPLRDDGYDIADYTNIHPDYGTLGSFRAFLNEAHRRGIRVVTELVVNHTSDQHPWFQAARHAPQGSAKREFYVWNDGPDKYEDARIIFKDFESSNWSWDAVAKSYYWHRFYSHQPDLNYDNPAVRRAIYKVMDFWLGMGVDGMRLDAVPYLYEREGTNCENLPETHEALRDLRRHVDRKFRDRMLLAEANQWPEDAIAYFGKGDECHMAFHFPVMPRLFMALSMEDRFPIIDILEQTPPIADTCQWAVFLRNHDELTLEMVTDEERDYMYRVYAHDRQMRINLGIRRRLAPLLGNNRRKIELLNGILFSLPGTPVLYYGDELGMGDNIYLGDRNGVRTPLQWSPDRNAGFSRANPQQLYLPVTVDPEYHYESINIEVQRKNSGSLLWWMKRLIALRKRYRAFGRGTLEFVYPDNRHVLAYIRQYDDERILVVANLSRFVQYVELNLAEFEGMTPVELFGGTEFPHIGELPYLLTLGPYAFYWFSIEPARTVELGAGAAGYQEPQTIAVQSAWEDCLSEKQRWRLEAGLPAFLMSRRWFGGKGQAVTGAEISEIVPIPLDGDRVYLLFTRVSYRNADDETYLLPVAIGEADRGVLIERDHGLSVIARLTLNSPSGESRAVVYDATVDEGLTGALLTAMARRRQFRGRHGALSTIPTRTLRSCIEAKDGDLAAHLHGGEQSNTSVTFGDQLIMKVFRRVDVGVNPDVEIGRLLTERGFEHTPRFAGALEYAPTRGEPTTVAVVQTFVRNEGDAWRYTLDELRRYVERELTSSARDAILPAPPHEYDESNVALRETLDRTFGPFLSLAELLGRRTAEMHATLASETRDAAFAPEPFSTLYQRSIYQSMRNLATNVLDLLRRRLRYLPESARTDARGLIDQDKTVFQRFRSVTGRKLSAMRIRIHGDYHLGQVLFTGKDFVIMDFEGEPARPISERRLKRCPLRDVAGMIRSYHYAAEKTIADMLDAGMIPEVRLPALREALDLWFAWTTHSFLLGYFAVAGDGKFAPKTQRDREMLLDVFVLEKALYELRYELNNRPDWVGIPLRGVLMVLSHGEGEDA